MKKLSSRILIGILFVFISCTQSYEKKSIDIESEKKSIHSKPNPKLIINDQVDHKSKRLQTNPFAKIDKYARACPKFINEDIKLLANYLQKNTKSDLEKARAIYVWLTDNISYNDDGYNLGNYGDNSVSAVLKCKKSVCEGFSNVFLAIGQEMNLEIKKVSGYAKGYGYTNEKRFVRTNHAWNIIKINQKWKVFDATWGEGNGQNINGKLVSVKEFDDYWFNVDPYEAIFSHLPLDKGLENVNPILDLLDYEEFPQIDKAYFQMGFSGKITYHIAYANKNLIFPKCYSIETPVKVIFAPNLGVLQTNKLYHFEYYIPKGLIAVLIDEKNNWHYFNEENRIFALKFNPRADGKIKICVKHDNGGNSFHTIMSYKVEKKKM